MWVVEELDGGIVAGSLMAFLESSEKTFHTISHSRSILVMSSADRPGRKRWLR